MPSIRPMPFAGRHRVRGLAVVEFAIILPVVLLIMLATAELGRVLYQYNTLTKAVRDGARYLANEAIVGGTLVIPVPIGATEQTRAKNFVVFGNRDGTGASLLPGLTIGQVTVTSPVPLHVRVQANYSYQPIFSSLPGFGVMSNISTAWTLSAETTMRAL